MEVIAIEKRVFEAMILRLEALEQRASRILGIYENSKSKKRWLDSQEVCILLNISKRTLQLYRDSGKIPYSMTGNKIYYKATDIEEWIKNQK